MSSQDRAESQGNDLSPWVAEDAGMAVWVAEDAGMAVGVVWLEVKVWGRVHLGELWSAPQPC